MTTKHVTEQSMHGTDTTVGASVADQTDQAEDASRQLLAKARYDAFRLMTEARDEAETILDEARAEAAGTRTAAELTAESTADKADTAAKAIIESAHEEAATIVARAHRTAGEQQPVEDGEQLEAEHKALSDRVSTLRSLADQLEDRFAALAKTVADPESERTPTTDVAAADNSGIDYAPSVAPQTKATREDASTGSDDRESFYNHHSANLPRLGEEGGRSAFNMTRMMRETMEND